MNSEKITCAWCGDNSHVEWIHGRGQCSSCKVILDEDYRCSSLTMLKISNDSTSGMATNNITKQSKYIKSVLKYFPIPI